MSNRYGLEIRAATGVDAPGLSELMTAGGYAVSTRQVAERLPALQASGAVLIALEWGPPSGLVAVHWHQTLQAARPVGEITMLLVGTEERRRGLGRLLLKAAARSARLADCEILTLQAAPYRDDLRAFCLANGFTQDGLRWMRPLRKGGKRDD